MSQNEAVENSDNEEAQAALGRALPVTVTVLLACAWAGCMGDRMSTEGRRASTSERYHQDALRGCRTDLSLRAVGIRVFAAREGRLPKDLSECREDTPTYHDLLKHYEKEIPVGTPLREWRDMAYGWTRQGLDFDLVDEPWNSCGYPGAPNTKTRPGVPPPPAEFDLFSLPVIYRTGKRDLGHAEIPSAWYVSDEGLPDVVKDYVKAKEVDLRPAPEKLALSSVFLFSKAREIRQLQDSLHGHGRFVFPPNRTGASRREEERLSK